MTRLTWPPGRPRVLITDAWLANAGDAAIAVSLDRLLRRLAPTAAVLHSSYQHDLVGPLIEELRVVPPLESLLGLAWAPPLPPDTDGTVGTELVAGADLVIAQGGGYLVEAYEPLGRIAAWLEIMHLGIPFVLAGVSVEHFRRSHPRRMLRQVFQHAQAVIVRDHESLLRVADLSGVTAFLGTDLAVGLFGDRTRPLTTRSGCSVILTDHHPDSAGTAARAELAGTVLDATVQSFGPDSCTFWSTVQGLGAQAGEDDAALAARLLAERGSATPDPRAPSHYIGPLEAVDLVARSNAAVTMRMHPALFALASGTPFTLVLPGQRRGVLAGLGLEEHMPHPDDRDSVVAAIARCATERPDGELIAAASATLWARFEETAAILGTIIDEL